MTRIVVFTLVVAALLALVVNHLFALALPWAIALSLPVAGVVLLGRVLAGAMDANWEPVPMSSTTRSDLHATTLAIRFAEAANDQHRYLTRVRPRLRRLALATLRGRPGTEDLTSLDDPRAEPALGTELYRLLTDDTAALPDPRRLAALLDRLEGS